MAMVAGARSTLNPNAPLFIPAAFRQVEDFSPEWWELVKTSTWFHDYWLSEHQDDSFSAAEEEDQDLLDLLPESLEPVFEDEDFIETQLQELALDGEDGCGKEKQRADAEAVLKSLSGGESPKVKSPKSPVGPAPKTFEKPAKWASSPKSASRRIHQPR